MSEITQFFGIHIEATAQVGALVVQIKDKFWLGDQTVAYLLDSNGNQVQPFYATYREYKQGAFNKIIAAVFPELPAGNYDAKWDESGSDKKKVTVYPGRVAQISFP